MNLPELHEHIARAWFDAFNRHHLEDLLELYSDTAEHFSPKLQLRRPETGGWIRGKDSLRAWWKDAFERLPSLVYEPTSFTANDQRVIMEYIRKVEAEPDMRVAEVLELSSGKIVASRVYHA